MAKKIKTISIDNIPNFISDFVNLGDVIECCRNRKDYTTALALIYIRDSMRSKTDLIFARAGKGKR